ncbi:MAG: sulfate adenylyltransferase, partial [Parcubacteria group bacterium CG11_big_fil_rev_8_21_14_0_20_41_14]
DFSDDLIIQTYEVLFEHYHDKQRAMLSVLPIQMRYAGPREALHHALVRRNFGCTHMIIGRDHAGVGNYYGPFDAQNIFDRFDQKDLGIEILKFGNAHYCSECGDIVFSDNHEHTQDDAYSVSGTKLREMVQTGQNLPEYIVRPEISDIIKKFKNPLV